MGLHRNVRELRFFERYSPVMLPLARRGGKVLLYARRELKAQTHP
jgi:hypothetical protein